MASPIAANPTVAGSIVTAVSLNGSWASGGVTGPFISVSGNAISVDMSAYQRPFAAGSVLDSSNISVTFGDDNTYTAKLIPGITALSDEILWSNGTIWTRTLFPLTTLVDLNGQWVSAGTSTPVMNISVTDKSISVDMPLGRPLARGYVLDFADIFVDFPDDAGFTGQLVLPNTIQWSNNSTWQKVPLIPSITLELGAGRNSKNLSVAGSGFMPGPVMIRITSQGFPTAQFTAVAAADGKFSKIGSISCTNGAHLEVSVFQFDPAAPVATASTVCTSTPP